MTDAIKQPKLAAIMFTDMAGYSALSQRDDKLALERRRARFCVKPSPSFPHPKNVPSTCTQSWR
jgi:hypothetical protein